MRRASECVTADVGQEMVFSYFVLPGMFCMYGLFELACGQTPGIISIISTVASSQSFGSN